MWTGDVISMKRYQRRKVQRLGHENQVLLERALFENLRPSPYVPHLLATPISSDSVALVLNCVLAGPLDIVLHSPLDEDSTRFIAASVVLAIELLHKVSLLTYVILYVFQVFPSLPIAASMRRLWTFLIGDVSLSANIMIKSSGWFQKCNSNWHRILNNFLAEVLDRLL